MFPKSSLVVSNITTLREHSANTPGILWAGWKITSISTLQRRLTGSSSNIPVNCPNGIKLYNSKMGGVDLMFQLKSAYQLDQRSKFQFYLHFFFLFWNFSMLLLSILLWCIRNWRTKI